ncbi:MAG: hypothetical protein ACJ741_08005, partial [Pyrinomonadaceae bacterium]
AHHAGAAHVLDHGMAGRELAQPRLEMRADPTDVRQQPPAHQFVEDAEGGRAVAVHSAAIIEALRKMYDAGKLADELTAR